MIKNSIGLLLIAIASFSSCSQNANRKEASMENVAIQSEDEKLSQFFELKFNQKLSRFPNKESALGIKKHQNLWDDESEAFQKQEIKVLRSELKELEELISYQDLSPNAKLSYDLFKRSHLEDIKYIEYKPYHYIVNQMHGIQAETPALLINKHSISSEEDALDYIDRLKNIESLMDQVVESLQKSDSMNTLPPKFVYDHVIRDCENLSKGYPINESDTLNTIWEDFTDKLGEANTIGKKRKEELLDKAKEALLKHTLPGYQHLLQTLYVQKEKTTEDDGVWKFPQGDQYYQFMLERMTTTKLNANEIHEIGLSEVKRIHSEMIAIKESVGFKGSLKEFFEFMRNDKQFYFEDTEQGREEYLAEAVLTIDNMKQKLDELFITKPKADIIVKRVEAFREKSAGKAFYEIPSPDGSIPGTYYANLYKMTDMPRYQLEALAFHEGIPGHHMQLSIAQELSDLPKFRKYKEYTAYVEGWGLYSESLGKEVGFYKDPYSDFGRLAMELWRSCRLVVDTGIHSKKWTRQESIDFYVSNTPNSVNDAVKMVERHVVMPGQATAYKIGMLKIIELREKSKTVLKDKFDIREFHDVILTDGALPLDILELKVNQWIASKGAQS
ncbi:DUF885 domain-containing protein [Aureibacter tunicatorum]|uniref:Uncharacterized protein (DUF885 family) n=1 Tax=Aureibacter tunicatorum TaxID=866807 RepID=A0AAE3XLQ5_9BACT|nr:DUF885 domain-containing protein [Aureibacter tunicatorum]MDR6239222.1 uncharacterized protein (DUF885 family) [Aureibacter tunicatorum]BDD04853.1 hypothetical protein AUTU_23360 [Aureibacter tunicatorum]